MRISEVSSAKIRDISVQASRSLDDFPYISDVVEAYNNTVYDEFETSLVLSRGFLTVPYEFLPLGHQEYAKRRASDAGLIDLLKGSTPVNTLVATKGRLTSWSSVYDSKDHMAIPLLSEEFVDSLPMIAHLLRALGLTQEWKNSDSFISQRSTVKHQVGYLCIEDPLNDLDDQGRRIVPDTQFIEDFGVRSVFAIAGTVFGGSKLILTFFSKDPVDARSIQTLLPLINYLKSIIVPRCSITRVFNPPKCECPGDEPKSANQITGARS